MASADTDNASVARLEIALDRSEYLLGEPFFIRVKLINLSGSQFAVNSYFHFDHQLQLYFRHESDSEMHVWRDSYLNPNVQSYGHVDVGVDGLHMGKLFSGGPFAKPGKVELKVKYEYFPQKEKRFFESNIIQITVSPPKPNETEAAKLWLDADVIDLAANPGMMMLNSEGSKKIKALAVKYPGTRYGEFARDTIKRDEDAVSAYLKANPPAVRKEKLAANAEKPTPAPAAAPQHVQSNDISRAEGKEGRNWAIYGLVGAVLLALGWLIARRMK